LDTPPVYSAPDAQSTSVSRQKQQIDEVARDGDGLRAQLEYLHKQLANKAQVPPKTAAPLLEQSLTLMRRETGQLREHIAMLHKQLADQALELALANAVKEAAAAKKRTQPQGAPKMSSDDLQKHWETMLKTRLLPESGKHKKANYDRYLEEQQAKREALGRKDAKKLARAELDAHVDALDKRGKRWASKQIELRKQEQQVASDDSTRRIIPKEEAMRLGARLHRQGAKVRGTPPPTDSRPAWGSRHAASTPALKTGSPRPTSASPTPRRASPTFNVRPASAR